MLDGGIITACYWQNNQAQGIGFNQAGTTDGTTQVDGDWTEAMNAMNTALQSAGSEWHYELTGELPTLKKIVNRQAGKIPPVTENNRSITVVSSVIEK